MKTFSQYLAKITLLVLLVTFLYLPATIKIAQAAGDEAVCTWVNAQNGSVGDAALQFTAPAAGTTETAEQKKTRQDAYNAAYTAALAKQQSAKDAGAAYQNKIVVITEEALGTPAANFSTTCARLTKCSSGNYDINNANPIRKCFTTYTTTSECSSITPNDKEALQDQTKPLNYCEIVQIYFADGGTSLLYGYIGAIYRYVAVLGGFIAVLVLIIAGVMRSASGDNPEMMTKANQLVVRCISGLIVLFLSAVILYTINPNFFVI